MIDADRIDLVIRPGGIRIEDAARNFLGFIERVLLGNRVRYIDRQKLWFASAARGRSQGVNSDLAIQWAHGHECIEVRVARQLFDLVDAKLRDRDLVGSNAGFGQDNTQQCDIGRGLADHANAMSGEIVERLDFRCRLSLGALAREAGRRPQHNEVLAHDGDDFGVTRHTEVAATDG